MSWAASLYTLLDKSLQFFIKQEDDDIAIPPLSLPEEYTVSLVPMSLIPCRSPTFASGWSELLGQRSSIRGRLCRAETSRSNQCRRSASPRTSLRPTRVLLLTHLSLRTEFPRRKSVFNSAIVPKLLHGHSTLGGTRLLSRKEASESRRSTSRTPSFSLIWHFR